MAALATGKKAPEFELEGMDRKSFCWPRRLLAGRWCWRSSKCRVRLASMRFRFWSGCIRLTDKGVTLVGVSQNKAKDTAAFIKEFGVTFPVLLDDTSLIRCRMRTG